MKRVSTRAKDPLGKVLKEADICQPIMDHMRSLGWRVYPEWGIYDFLCAIDTPDGERTVGVQAKLKWTPGLIRQCIESLGKAHWTVALIGKESRTGRKDYMPIAKHIGVVMVTWRPGWLLRKDQWSLKWFENIEKEYFHRGGKYFCEKPTYDLPPFEYDMAAGVPNPGGYPTPFSLGVRKIVDYAKCGKEITITEAAVLSGIGRSGVRVIFWTIANQTGKRGNAYLYKLKENAEELAKEMAPGGWVKAIEKKEKPCPESS